jgi:predicted nucleic acid-binding protein
VEAATVVGTSAIAYVEARAALARRRRSGHLSARSQRIVLRALDADWLRYLRLEVTEDLIHEAATIAEHHALRAYDAIHLASAVLLSRRLGGATMFASWDDALDAAAAREGLRRLRG